MKTILIPLLLALPAQAQTVEEVQKLAVKNSARLQVLTAELNEAEARRQESSYLRRPHVGLAGGAEFEATRKEKDLLPLAYAYVNYALYEGGQAAIQKDLAQKDLEMRQQDLPFSEAEMGHTVEALFLDYAFAEEKMRVLDKGMKLFDQLRARAKKRQLAGLIGESDVLEFDLRKSDFLLRQAEVEGSRVVALKALALLSGQEIKPQGAGLPAFDVTAGSKDEAADSQGNRETLRWAKEKEILELEKSRQSALWEPRVEFEARAGRLPSEGFEDKHEPRVDALLVAKWDLFSSGQKNAAMMALAARGTTLSLKAVESERLRAEGLGHLRAQSEVLKAKYQVHQRRLGPAKRYYQATLDEFERGVKNAPDVAHAAETFWETEMRDLEFRHEGALKRLERKRLLLKAGS